jgi:hypothetical protein
LKYKSFIYIALGFIIGQGAMFLAQTYLIMEGKLELLSQVGIGLGFLSLLQWLSDMGGTFLTSRYLNESKYKLASFFAASVLLFVICIIIYFIILSIYKTNEFTSGVLKYGVVILLLGSLNLTGLVDYLQRNKAVSPFSGLHWLFCSIALVVFGNNIAPHVLGEILGISYVVGVLVNLVIQFLFTKAELVPIIHELKKLKFKSVVNVFFEGVAYNISFVASQSYGRFIPLIIEKYVGAPASGVFIYTRNITNMCGQFVMFARRVEFRSLIKLEISSFTFFKLFNKQKFSFMISGLFFVGVIFIKVMSLYVDNLIENQHEIITSLIWLSTIFLGFNLSSMFSQYLLSLGKMYLNSFVQSVSIALTFIFIFSFISEHGLYSVYFSELLMHFLRICIFVFMIFIFRRNKNSIEVRGCNGRV